MEERTVERKLAAIFAADVEGYSRLMGLDEVGTLRTLTAYRVILDRLIASHRGRIFNTAGDSILADFASAVDAVQCAVEVQEAIAKENADRPAGEQMRFRIGIHVGDIIVQGDDLFGDAVNIAARLEALAEPGGICVSGTVRDHIGTKLALSFTDLGEQQVKNIAQPIKAYRIGNETSPAANHRFRLLASPSREAFHRGAAVPEHEWRSRTGIFRGRHGRGDYHAWGATAQTPQNASYIKDLMMGCCAVLMQIVPGLVLLI